MSFSMTLPELTARSHIALFFSSLVNVGLEQWSRAQGVMLVFLVIFVGGFAKPQ